jgi:hypothetical protein
MAAYYTPLLALCTLLAIMTGTAKAAGPGTTLQKGHFWIRAVTKPSKHVLFTSHYPCPNNMSDFHKYLQTKPALVPGIAILDDYTTAGQFAIQNGQFMELISSPGETPKHLYATVSPKKQKDGRTLSMNFTSSPGTFGKFAFQGDSVTWTPPAGDIKRKNNAAWYVCEKQQLFLNLMDYMAPPPLPGCSDHTVSFLRV